MTGSCPATTTKIDDYDMRKDLRIPILAKKLGVPLVTEEVADKLEAALADPDNQFSGIVGALINVHKSDYADTRAIRDKFSGMTISLERRSTSAGDCELDLALSCENVPVDCLYDGENVIYAAVEQISSAVRDLVFAPDVNGHATGAGRSVYVKKFAEHAGLLYRGERGLVTFVWGGHRVSREEYDFAKAVSYWLTLRHPDMEIITGCGTGIMKAPFKGASVAYSKQRAFERFGRRDFIGLTEKAILAAEPPNELVNRFVVFPSIESRMEAFIRCSHRGRAHPGGPGTMEEIMTMLSVLSHPDNRGIPYPFDLVERPESKYFSAFADYMAEVFRGEMDRYYAIHRTTPSDYARIFQETSKALPQRYLWNDEIHFDENIQVPYEVSFEAMETLDLSRDQPPFDLLINLRRFFSAIVHLSVKDPDLLDSWGTDRPRIHGDKDILQATDTLVKRLEAQGRIHPNPKYTMPYRIA